MSNTKLENILEKLSANPVIPCMDSYEEIFSSEYKDIRIIFFYNIGIFDLLEINKRNITAKKDIIIHIDSVRGISSDEEGARFIKNYLNIDIVSSTSPKMINCFKKLGFITIQSIFVVDTKSIAKGAQLIKAGRPDIVDMRPGILYPKASGILPDALKDIPVICSGFISNKSELENILKHGAKGITSSKKELWTLYL